VLKATVKADPQRTREYLALGKLYRRRGHAGRAARLFEQLRARPGIDRQVSLAAQYELALAYRALRWDEAALSTLEQVLAADPSHAEARRELRRLHEDGGRWEQAAALELLRLKWGESRDHRTLAALLTQQGKAAWAAGQLRESGVHLRTALRLDPDCTEAALYLGRVWLGQKRWSQAFRLWDELAEARPEWLFLAFRDMQEAFRQLNNEEGWGRFLHDFTERHPGDALGHLALAEWSAARGQMQQAIGCLQQVLEIDPVCPEAHVALLSLCREPGTASAALDSYARLVHHVSELSGARFRCRACGHGAFEPFWRCPACRRWDTPERLGPRTSAVPGSTGGLVPPDRPAPSDPHAAVLVTRDAAVYPWVER
jgi:lipopolysaccharide biosynthesis regulator YciM